ncbi:ATP-binding protein [Halosimplex sp. J119]
MTGQATHLGSIEDVEGARASVLLNEETNFGLSFVEGYGYRVGQIGSFVRIPLGYDDIFGVVSQVGARAAPQADDEDPSQGNKWITVQFVGEAAQGQELTTGLSKYPTVGDDVHIVTKDELPRIYGRGSSSGHINIGSVVGSEQIPARVDLNNLVSRHAAVLGSTGSGKSTTIAGLLHTLATSPDIESPRVLVLDIHGEYGEALRDSADVFTMGASEERGELELEIPYWALSFEELIDVAFGEVQGDRDRAALVEQVENKKRESYPRQGISGIDESEINVDTPVPFSIHKLWSELYKLVRCPHTESRDQSLNTVAYATDEDGSPIDRGSAMEVRTPETRRHDQYDDVYVAKPDMNIGRQVDTLTYRLRDSRYDFLFRPGDWLPNEDGVVNRDLDELLEKWVGHDPGISILDLSGIPSDILDTLVGALLRIVYNSLFWARNRAEGGKRRPLLVVLEEAHSYASDTAKGSAADSIQRIVKEGRKYGIGAMLVSQRPTEIDSTILSQCGTIFSMRMSNSKDRGSINSVVSDNMEGILSSLPILQTGEAIIVGQGVKFPIRARIDPPPPDHRPESQDPPVISENDDLGWNQNVTDQNYDKVLEHWRKKDPDTQTDSEVGDEL